LFGDAAFDELAGCGIRRDLAGRKYEPSSSDGL
jgi:hypothetical protein